MNKFLKKMLCCVCCVSLLGGVNIANNNDTTVKAVEVNGIEYLASMTCDTYVKDTGYNVIVGQKKMMYTGEKLMYSKDERINDVFDFYFVNTDGTLTKVNMKNSRTGSKFVEEGCTFNFNIYNVDTGERYVPYEFVLTNILFEDQSTNPVTTTPSTTNTPVVTTTPSTEKTTPKAPKITVASKTKNKIVLKKLKNCQYRLKGKKWGTSNVFKGLKKGTKYTVQARYKATATTNASKITSKVVKTKSE